MTRLFNFLIACGSFPHLRSAHKNVKKFVVISNCLTIGNTSCEKCFQHASVPSTEFKLIKVHQSLIKIQIKTYWNI